MLYKSSIDVTLDYEDGWCSEGYYTEGDFVNRPLAINGYDRGHLPDSWMSFSINRKNLVGVDRGGLPDYATPNGKPTLSESSNYDYTDLDFL